MIPKETLFDMARGVGLAGPEIVEERQGGYLLACWVYGGTSGNRAFVKIDTEMTQAEAKEEIATLLRVPQTRGNVLASQAAPTLSAPTVAPPPATGLKARG